MYPELRWKGGNGWRRMMDDKKQDGKSSNWEEKKKKVVGEVFNETGGGV